MSEQTVNVEAKPQSHRRGRDGGRHQRRDDRPQEENPYIEKLVYVNRTTKVVKGGRRFSFSALLVIGDGKGRVGQGFGKANEVADAIKKATEAAKKSMITVALHNGTIPHEVNSEFCGGQVLLRPASPGTGIIAGGGVRAVLEAAGVKDVLTKAQGSHNPGNIVKATLKALASLRTATQIRKARGLAS